MKAKTLRWTRALAAATLVIAGHVSAHSEEAPSTRARADVYVKFRLPDMPIPEGSDVRIARSGGSSGRPGLRRLDASGGVSLPADLARTTFAIVEIGVRGGPRFLATLSGLGADADRHNSALPPWDLRSRIRLNLATVRVTDTADGVEWLLDWMPGVRPLRVRIETPGMATAAARVIDLESWEVVAPAADGTVWFLDHPQRTRGVVVAPEGGTPVALSAAALRAAPPDGATTVRQRDERPRRLEVRFRGPASLTGAKIASASLWTWDTATGVLAGRGSAIVGDDGVGVATVDRLGSGPVDGLIQVVTASGSVAAAWFSEPIRPAESDVTLTASAVEYAPREWAPAIVLGSRRGEARVSARVRAVAGSDERMLVGDGGIAVRVEPGTYHVSEFAGELGGPLHLVPIDLRVRDGLVATVRMDDLMREAEDAGDK